MRTKVQKWGNSLAIRVPRPFAEELGLRQDSDVDLLLAQRELVIRPIAVPRYSLEDLLAAVTADNVHREVDTSDPVGNEAW
ncbi:MAG: AbrB/MazE/SpoVT family DNA-binding domain-containing protein [Thermoanaerobaculia bacterium]